MMRLDPRKGELNVDIQNMFNTMCRVAMLEDLLDTGKICPTLDDKDFSDMIPYLNMTYGSDSSLWFRIDPPGVRRAGAAAGEVRPEELPNR